MTNYFGSFGNETILALQKSIKMNAYAHTTEWNPAQAAQLSAFINKSVQEFKYIFKVKKSGWGWITQDNAGQGYPMSKIAAFVKEAKKNLDEFEVFDRELNCNATHLWK